LTLNISSREIARIHKKAAESYFKMGDVGRAREALQRAFEVNPKLTGAKRISRELGMKNGMPEASS
jgi:Tfp pilus assembly protein PilF